MYIAIKWLICLCLFMWGLMCCLDVYLHCTLREGKGNNVIKSGYSFENISIPHKEHYKLKYKYIQRDRLIYSEVPVFQYIMFTAGALLVSLLHKKKEIAHFIKKILIQLDLETNIIKYLNKIDIKNIYELLGGFCCKLLIVIWDNLKYVNNKGIEFLMSVGANDIEEHEIECEMLIQKLKEVNEDRKKLSQYLVTAMEENKNIRMKLQLESMAKERLLKHVENTNKQIKETRTRFFNFRNLYLVTHQENIFLKARLKKLTTEKVEVEQNLMNLLQKVYQSKNSELRAYCSRFIVRSKYNLLNSDVTVEINNFLQKSKRPIFTSSNWTLDKFGENANNFVVTEMVYDNEFLDVDKQPDSPKLKGLPGENDWSEKNCVVEKFYSYESNSGLNKVSWELGTYTASTDHLIGNSKQEESPSSNMIVIPVEHEAAIVTTSSLQKLENRTTNEKFLTGSRAFQNFLKNNTNISPPGRPQESLLYA